MSCGLRRGDFDGDRRGDMRGDASVIKLSGSGRTEVFTATYEGSMIRYFQSREGAAPPSGCRSRFVNMNVNEAGGPVWI